MRDEEESIEAERKKKDTIRFIANVILKMDTETLALLRDTLEDEGGSAGVASVIPPNLPLKESGAEVPFEDWPEEYWESQG